MPSKLRATVLFTAVILTSALLAACGGSDKSGGSSTSSSTSKTPGGADTGDQGTVNALGIWGADELDSFNAMVKPWNGKVNFTGSRDITALLTARVQGGSPPDVAMPAETGLFRQFAKDGKLTPLSKCPGLEEAVKAQYPQAYQDLGTVNGTLYGFFMKADSKATVWYNPAFFQQKGYKPLTAESSFDDL